MRPFANSGVCAMSPDHIERTHDMPNDPYWRLPEAPEFTLESTDFAPGGSLPTSARADGGNRNPELHWSGAPEGTRSFVVSLYDPDAPTGSGFWHWAVYGLPADTTSIPAGGSTTLPEPAVTIANEMGAEEFMGAAPPPGDGPHRYFFTVTALDVESVELPEGARPSILGFTMREHVIGRSSLMGTMETPA